MEFTEHKPWGNYKILHEDENCKVKIITVKPNQAPSYQSHEKRCEKYIILQGTGLLTLDGQLKTVEKGDIVTVDFKQKHRIRCLSDDDLIFIEVQLGSYFGEDDIVRHEDDYERN